MVKAALLLDDDFTPAAVPGLVLWVDAMDMGSLSDDSDNPITADALVKTWRDKSGRGNNAANATAGQQPRFRATGMGTGRPALEFYADGNFDVLNVTDNADFNYSGCGVYAAFNWKTNTGSQQAVVAKYNTTGNQREIAMAINTTPNLIFISSTDGTGGTVTNAVATDTISTATNYIGSARWNGTTKTAQVNLTGNSGTDSPASIYAGTANVTIGCLSSGVQGLQGYIGEVLFYNQSISSANHTLIVNYLKAKWAA